MAWPESWILAFGELLQARQVRFTVDATLREGPDVRNDHEVGMVTGKWLALGVHSAP